MSVFIKVLIYLGSALMIYNIIRYGAFVNDSKKLEQQSLKAGVLTVPLLLLIFFLVGYLVVGFSGIADLLMASILFGGSVFVFLLLTVMYSIISHIRDTDRVLAHRYDEMLAELNAITRDSLAAFLVNLTRDKVEQRAGNYLYDSDYACDAYSELLKVRAQYVLEASYDAGQSRFRREELLRLYDEGQTTVSEVLLVRRRDGEAGYVRFEATLSKLPVTGDVVAFLIEQPYNDDMVRQTLLEEVMMDQYDRIAYLIDGKYRVVISNTGKKTGLLLPDDEDDTYESLYLNYILPTMVRDSTKASAPNPLRLSVIDKALEEQRVYDINAPFVIDGEKHYKHIVFYRISSDAKFYLMLVSDSTQLQEEQAALNQRLSDALAEAERAQSARSGFFARVTRDLLDPVEDILQSVRQACAGDVPAVERGCMERIDASGRKLHSLLEDVFAMSSIDSGAAKLDEKPADLCALTEKLAAEFAAVRPEKRLSFHGDTSGLRESVVYCDEQLLRRVLSRLLENSCVFAPEEGVVTLTVSQGEETQGERLEYEFSIRNAGLEIPEDVIDRLFEETAWDQNEKRGELPGVGLGMAVAKAYVDAMGGSVCISSDRDGDTNVKLRFFFRPVPKAPEEEEDRRTAEPAEEELHVLLVDDNELNREIGELMLTGEGWTVELAADGAEAVEKAAAAPGGNFDLILMDVNMPVMNGYEATAAIRALPDRARASVPIIALTAGASPESAREALAAGMSGFVSKPIDPTAIRRELARLRDGE